MMQKPIYNLEFLSWCKVMTIHGYTFTRVDDYEDQVKRLQHLTWSQSEFTIPPAMGEHVVTAYVEIPSQEEGAVLDWSKSNATALDDVLLLLSIFTRRDVFYVENEDTKVVYGPDSNLYRGGGILLASIPYKASQTDRGNDEPAYDVGWEEGLNRVYSLMRAEGWQQIYGRGYYLFLAKQAFHEQTIESAFTQCWTIWEHLFSLLNQDWLTDKQIQQLESSVKVGFILTRFDLKKDLDDLSRTRIKGLANIRNRLIHFGRLPDGDTVYDDAVLFVQLTEFIIAKTLGLSPSNIFNTTKKLEKFFADAHHHKP